MKVSAIMPARGRQHLSRLAVASFLAQTYEHKELIILDDEEEPAFAGQWLDRETKTTGYCLLDYPVDVVRYFRLGGKKTIAEKRNELCELATGEIIMHFDTDDWSAPDRMADQVQRLQESGLAVTGYHSMLFYDEIRNAAVKYRGYSKQYAVGTSFAFLKSFWKTHPFPTVTVVRQAEQPLIIGEDNKFLTVARQAKQVISTDAEKRMVARIHQGNTCHKDLNGCSFQPVPLTDLPKDFLQ